MTRKGPRAAIAARYGLRRRLYQAREMARPTTPHQAHKPATASAGVTPAPAAGPVHTAEEVNLLRETIIRQRAEFDNFRKRTQREKDQVRELATEGLLSHLLPVLDNMERALLSAESAADVKSVRDGVQMISIQLRRTLESEGLEQVKALHEQFDPAIHDALAAEEREDVPDGQVCEVLLPGYFYKHKLLRPAMVKVARRRQRQARNRVAAAEACNFGDSAIDLDKCVNQVQCTIGRHRGQTLRYDPRERDNKMRNRLIVFGIATTMMAGGNLVAAPGDAPAEQQSLLSRLRQRSSATRQQVQGEPEQLAQNRGYQPGVTFPQQQQQPQQPPVQQQVYPQPQYPAYPPQPVAPPVQGAPYNMQGQQQTPAARQGQPTGQTNQANSARTREDGSGETSRQSGSRSRSSSSTDSDSDEKSSSRSSSSSSSAKKSDSDESKKSSSSSSDEKKSSSKSESSSALEKIAKKVESEDSEDKPKKAEKTPEPKKSDEEIAREKAHAAFLKAADEATTVVASFLKQANDGYYSKAAESLSPAIQKYFDSEMSAVNGTQKGVLDELTANGTITMVTYINTTVRGEGAVVEAELGYADGRTTQRSFDLIKIDDKWKIVLPVKGLAGAAGAPARRASNATSANAAAATPAPAAVQATPTATDAPLTPEQAAARAVAPLVLAPDAGTSAPQ